MGKRMPISEALYKKSDLRRISMLIPHRDDYQMNDPSEVDRYHLALRNAERADEMLHDLHLGEAELSQEKEGG